MEMEFCSLNNTEKPCRWHQPLWQTLLLKQSQERKVNQEERVLSSQRQRGFPWCPVKSRLAHLPWESQTEGEWGKPLFEEPPARTGDFNKVFRYKVSPLNSYRNPSSYCLPQAAWGQWAERSQAPCLYHQGNSEQRLQTHCPPQILQLNPDWNKYILMIWL